MLPGRTGRKMILCVAPPFSSQFPASAIVNQERQAIMNDIYANDPTPPISEKQKQELAASLDSAGSTVPLRPSDLHTRTMIPRIREQIAKWVPQGPAAAGIPKTHGPLEKIDVIPSILAVPTLDEDGDKIQIAKKILFKVLRSVATDRRCGSVALERVSVRCNQLTMRRSSHPPRFSGPALLRIGPCLYWRFKDWPLTGWRR
jgi:hypothetical protein